MLAKFSRMSQFLKESVILGISDYFILKRPFGIAEGRTYPLGSHKCHQMHCMLMICYAITP